MATIVDANVYICDINNNITDDISSFVELVSVDWNDARQIKMSATFNIRRDSNWIYTVDPYTNFLAPYMTLIKDSGEVITEQVGLYALDIPQKSADIAYTMDYFQGMDLTWLLATSAFDRAHNYSLFSRRDSTIRMLCNDVGITRTGIAPKVDTFPHALTLPAGTFRLDAANYIAQGMGYYSVYANRTGEILTNSIVDLSAIAPHATYTMDDMWTIPRKRPVATSIANVIIVTKDNPNDVPLLVTARNDDSDDPMSTANRQTIARVYNNSDFISEVEMQKFAYRTLKAGNSLYVSLDLTVPPDPTINPRSVIDLVYNTGQDDFSGRYSVDVWKMGFSDKDAPLQLTVSRYEPLFTDI